MYVKITVLIHIILHPPHVYDTHPTVPDRLACFKEYDEVVGALGIKDNDDDAAGKSGDRDTCFNCGKTDHKFTDCPAPLNPTVSQSHDVAASTIVAAAFAHFFYPFV